MAAPDGAKVEVRLALRSAAPPPASAPCYFVVAYRRYEGKPWEEVARTEAGRPGCVDPNFLGSIRLKYAATMKQAIKLQVYSCPLSGSAGDLSFPAVLPEGFTLYGEDECELKDFMTAPGFTLFDPLCLNDEPVKGMVKLTGVLMDSAVVKAGVANLRLACSGLDAAPNGANPDPFLLIYRQAEAGSEQWELAWTTEPARSTRDPVFDSHAVPVMVLYKTGDTSKPLKFDIRHWSDSGDHALLGSAQTSVAALVSGTGKGAAGGVPVTNPAKGNAAAGTLYAHTAAMGPLNLAMTAEGAGGPPIGPTHMLAPSARLSRSPSPTAPPRAVVPLDPSMLATPIKPSWPAIVAVSLAKETVPEGSEEKDAETKSVSSAARSPSAAIPIPEPSRDSKPAPPPPSGPKPEIPIPPLALAKSEEKKEEVKTDHSWLTRTLSDSPFVLDLAALLEQGGGNGADGRNPASTIACFDVKQVLRPDNVLVDRKLVVTPYTIMVLGPHPFKPGLYQLKWERSLLSAAYFSAQKVATNAVDAPAGTSEIISPISSSGPATVTGTLGRFASKKITKFVRRLTRGASASAETDTTLTSAAAAAASADAVGIDAAEEAQCITRTTRRSRSPSPAPAASSSPAEAPEEAVWGIKIGFAAERSTSWAYLRAARGPAELLVEYATRGMSGELAKQKGGDAISPGWKRRAFHLGQDILSYHPSSGEGKIRLSPWTDVERGVTVGREGVGRGTTGFIVRTDTQKHIFDADNEFHMNYWCDNIGLSVALSCATLPAGSDEACQTLILKSAQEARELSTFLLLKREAIPPTIKAEFEAAPAGRPLISKPATSSELLDCLTMRAFSESERRRSIADLEALKIEYINGMS